MSWQSLKDEYPWPEVKPDVPPNLNDGWFCGQNMKMIRDSIRELNPILIVEVGSWLGLSTRFICDNAPSANVIAIDHWKGSEEHIVTPEWAKKLPTLYETFLVNCWKYKNSLLPIRESSIQGLRKVHEHHLTPDLIYVDAAHDAKSVELDLLECLSLFPKAKIIGDDWTHETVREGVMRALSKDAGNLQYDLRTFQTCYEIYMSE